MCSHANAGKVAPQMTPNKPATSDFEQTCHQKHRHLRRKILSIASMSVDKNAFDKQTCVQACTQTDRLHGPTASTPAPAFPLADSPRPEALPRPLYRGGASRWCPSAGPFRRVAAMRDRPLRSRALLHTAAGRKGLREEFPDGCSPFVVNGGNHHGQSTGFFSIPAS